MKLVKTMPRYKCDFCRHKSTASAMVRHERICWNNPDRFCPLCENTGVVDTEDGTGREMECYWCSKRNDLAN